MTRIVIAPASVLSLFALHKLFASAVTAHFAYFPEKDRSRIIQDHSVSNLLKARIDHRRIILLAKADKKIIGYAIGAAPASGPAQLFWLYVDPAYRGANTGLSLLSRMLKHLASTGAKVVTIATHEHRSYYERQGFKYVREDMIDGVKMDILTFRLRADNS